MANNFLSSTSLILRSLAKKTLTDGSIRSVSQSSPKRSSNFRLPSSSLKATSSSTSFFKSQTFLTTTTTSLRHLSTSPQTSQSTNTSSSSSSGEGNFSSTSPQAPINTITSHSVTIDGQKLHYEIAGSGPHVVLLLPGAIGTGLTDFEHQLKGLDGEQFTLVAWDPPGYGKSRNPEKDLKDFNDFYRTDAEMAAKLMKKLNHHRYSVLGWSDGGKTGMILTANAGSSAVQKLIIWGANAFVNEEDRGAMHKVRNPATDWSPTFRDTFISIYGEEYFYRLWDRLVANYMRLDDICKGDLPAITCPVLILHGDQDPMLSSEHPVYLVNNISNATLYRFPKGKHNIHQRYAAEFNQLVSDFLMGT